MSYAPPTEIRCTAGAILDPFQYVFVEADGDVIDLTGYTCQVGWTRTSSGETGLITSPIVNGGATGTVTFWVPEALTATGPEVLELVVWAGNGSDLRLDGRRWTVRVAAPIGSTPTN